MELTDAERASKLMCQRNQMLDMGTECDKHLNTEWNLVVCERKMRIPYDVKGFFIRAIYAALDEIEKEIKAI